MLAELVIGNQEKKSLLRYIVVTRMMVSCTLGTVHRNRKFACIIVHNYVCLLPAHDKGLATTHRSSEVDHKQRGTQIYTNMHVQNVHYNNYHVNVKQEAITQKALVSYNYTACLYHIAIYRSHSSGTNHS